MSADARGAIAYYDKQSVAIEFANELALDLDGDRLYAFGMNTPNTIHTGLFLNSDWRGVSYFAQLDEAQVDAGIELTLDIWWGNDISVKTVEKHYFNFDDEMMAEMIEGWKAPPVDALTQPLDALDDSPELTN